MNFSLFHWTVFQCLHWGIHIFIKIFIIDTLTSLCLNSFGFLEVCYNTYNRTTGFWRKFFFVLNVHACVSVNWSGCLRLWHLWCFFVWVSSWSFCWVHLFYYSYLNLTSCRPKEQCLVLIPGGIFGFRIQISLDPKIKFWLALWIQMSSSPRFMQWVRWKIG